MLLDAGTALKNWIGNTGQITKTILVLIPPLSEGGSVTYFADNDGLCMTTRISAPSGLPALLTAIFPMTYQKAAKKLKQGRLPIVPGDGFEIVRRHDTVVGNSGERYTRFICKPIEVVA